MVTLCSTVDEVWKPIFYMGKEFPYEVSNLGNVRHIGETKLKKFHFRPDGYVFVQLHCGKVNGKKSIKKINVHRLVATMFLGVPCEKMEVNHIDGDKLNNTVSNLEWVTRKENIRHAYRTGLNKVKKGFGSRHSKYTQDQIRLAIELLADGYDKHKASELSGVKESTIEKIQQGRRYSELARIIGYAV